MTSILISLTFISVAIAFAATLISGLIKLAFFLKQKDTYRHILKFALWEEIVGLVIMILIWTLYKEEFNNWAEPEVAITIPFYLMLIGQLAGLVITFRSRQKSKSVC